MATIVMQRRQSHCGTDRQRHTIRRGQHDGGHFEDDPPTPGPREQRPHDRIGLAAAVRQDLERQQKSATLSALAVSKQHPERARPIPQADESTRTPRRFRADGYPPIETALRSCSTKLTRRLRRSPRRRSLVGK